MKLDIQKFTLDGNEHAFVFNRESNKVIVKNFTDSDIYVAFEQGASEDESIKIPTMLGQICQVQESPLARFNVVYVTGTGDVEVQLI